MYSALADLDVGRGWGEVAHTCHADVGSQELGSH